MPLILLVGRDMRLLATRAAVLAELGATIKWGTRRLIDPILRREPVDLLVLCHTLPLEEREEIVAATREASPSAEVLQLVSTIEFREMRLLPGVNIGVCDPASLVRTVEELLGESAHSQAATGHRSAYPRALTPDWFNGNVNSVGVFEGALRQITSSSNAQQR